MPENAIKVGGRCEKKYIAVVDRATAEGAKEASTGNDHERCCLLS